MNKEDVQAYARENIRLTASNRKLKAKVKKLEAELSIYRAQDKFHTTVIEALRKVKP